MKLYVCYGTWTAGKPVHAHPCGEAHKALVEAGHRPEVVRSYGLGLLPGLLNDLTPRREVKRLTGNYWVPVLVLDDGTVIQGSRRIIGWAPGRTGGAARGRRRRGPAARGLTPAMAAAPAAARAAPAPRPRPLPRASCSTDRRPGRARRAARPGRQLGGPGRQPPVAQRPAHGPAQRRAAPSSGHGSRTPAPAQPAGRRSRPCRRRGGRRAPGREASARTSVPCPAWQMTSARAGIVCA